MELLSLTPDQWIPVKIRNMMVIGAAMTVSVAYIPLISITYMYIISILSRIMSPYGAAALTEALLTVYTLNQSLILFFMHSITQLIICIIRFVETEINIIISLNKFMVGAVATASLKILLFFNQSGRPPLRHKDRKNTH